MKTMKGRQQRDVVLGETCILLIYSVCCSTCQNVKWLPVLFKNNVIKLELDNLLIIMTIESLRVSIKSFITKQNITVTFEN